MRISRCISGLGADGALSGGLKAGDSVPMKYKENIWSNKNVDMYDILYPNKEHAMALTIQGDEDNPTLGVVSKRKYELEELEWATAFDDFMAVYLLKYPNDRSDILTYAKHIKIMMRDQLNWRAYDQKFRQGREMTGCKWSSIRVDLQIECSSLYASSHSSNPIPASPRFHMRSQCVPVGYCYSFHSRNQNCVAGAVCTYNIPVPIVTSFTLDTVLALELRVTRLLHIPGRLDALTGTISRLNVSPSTLKRYGIQLCQTRIPKHFLPETYAFF